MSNQPHPSNDDSQSHHLNFFFRLAVVVATVFVVTILAFVAAIFGDPTSPAIRIINHYGGQMILWEVVALLVVVVLAMVVDQWRNRKPRETLTERPTSKH
ncbi:hypothetical protein [Thalassoroseus pseudoceratinae]|uniref:hypothetical protein n=1 Tax=Thalassoroseus pseudoceratinae TaxID=2713176 RepID=UPI00141E002C|nr:hypothetical protein [Thalassoroseus pseudoceratinae]